MSLNLSDEEIHGLNAYARDKFAAEQYPFAPSLRPIGKCSPSSTRSRSTNLADTEAFRAELVAAKEEQAAALTPG